MLITVEQASPEKLTQLGVSSWPTWSKEVAEFPWTYSSRETAYILEGEATVTPDGGVPVRFKKGDLVVFPSGMSCMWRVEKTLLKHYRFD
ncbi:MAG: cupin domain-containing protein [Methylophilaceae bacterium]|nr:cupin domain-containing protein [Methylophilaceae bacterium]